MMTSIMSWILYASERKGEVDIRVCTIMAFVQLQRAGCLTCDISDTAG